MRAATMTLTYRTLAFAGLAIVVLSIGWWWTTYRTVIDYNYMSLGSASTCLVSNTDMCKLARSLCSSTHPLTIIAYWSASIWIGAFALSASLFCRAASD